MSSSLGARRTWQHPRDHWLSGAAIVTCLYHLQSVYAAALEVATLAKTPAIDGDIGESEWSEARGRRPKLCADRAGLWRACRRFEPSSALDRRQRRSMWRFEAFDPEISRLAAAITQRDAIDPTRHEQQSSSRMIRSPCFSIRSETGERLIFFAPMLLPHRRTRGLPTTAARSISQWDGTWRSAAMRRDDRWTVEFEIPFSTLLYAAGGSPLESQFRSHRSAAIGNRRLVGSVRSRSSGFRASAI